MGVGWSEVGGTDLPSPPSVRGALIEVGGPVSFEEVGLALES